MSESELNERRSKFETQISILLAVGHGTRKTTHIMQQCNLSYNNLIEHFDRLTKSGLIECSMKRLGQSTRQEFTLTEKGFKVIKLWSELRNSFNVTHVIEGRLPSNTSDQLANVKIPYLEEISGK